MDELQKYVEVTLKSQSVAKQFASSDEYKSVLQWFESLRRTTQTLHEFLAESDIFLKMLPIIYSQNAELRTFCTNVVLKAIRPMDNCASITTKHNECLKEGLRGPYIPFMQGLLRNEAEDWGMVWCATIRLAGTEIHLGGPNYINILLTILEEAFKSGNNSVRCSAFLCWQDLIMNFSLDMKELCSLKRIKLLLIPLKANNCKTDRVALQKFLTWWLLIRSMGPQLVGYIDMVLRPFLVFSFGLSPDIPMQALKMKDGAAVIKYSNLNSLGIDAFVQILGHKTPNCNCISVLDYRLETGIITEFIFKNLPKDICFAAGEVALLAANGKEKHGNVIRCVWSSLLSFAKVNQNHSNDVLLATYHVISALLATKELTDHVLHAIILEVVSTMWFMEQGRNLVNFAQFLVRQNVLLNDRCEEIRETVMTNLLSTCKENDKDLIISVFLQTSFNSVRTGEIVSDIWCLLGKFLTPASENSSDRIMDLIYYPVKSLSGVKDSMIGALIPKWVHFYEQFLNNSSLPQTIMHSFISFLKNQWEMVSLPSGSFSVFVGSLLNSFLSRLYAIQIPNKEFVEMVMTMLTQLLQYEDVEHKCCTFATLGTTLKIFYINFDAVSAIFVRLSKFLSVSFDLIKRNHDDFHEMLCTLVHVMKQIKIDKIPLDHLASAFKKLELYSDSNIKNLAVEGRQLCDSYPPMVKIHNLNPKRLKKEQKHIKSNSRAAKIVEMSNDNTVITKPKTSSTASSTIQLFGHNMDTVNDNKLEGVFRTKPNNSITKRKLCKKDSESDEFVVIKSNWKFDPSKFTERQKEKMKERGSDIPALYENLSQSNSQNLFNLNNNEQGDVPLKSIVKTSNLLDKNDTVISMKENSTPNTEPIISKPDNQIVDSDNKTFENGTEVHKEETSSDVSKRSILDDTGDNSARDSNVCVPTKRRKSDANVPGNSPIQTKNSPQLSINIVPLPNQLDSSKSTQTKSSPNDALKVKRTEPLNETANASIKLNHSRIDLQQSADSTTSENETARSKKARLQRELTRIKIDCIDNLVVLPPGRKLRSMHSGRSNSVDAQIYDFDRLDILPDSAEVIENSQESTAGHTKRKFGKRKQSNVGLKNVANSSLLQKDKKEISSAKTHFESASKLADPLKLVLKRRKKNVEAAKRKNLVPIKKFKKIKRHKISTSMIETRTGEDNDLDILSTSVDNYMSTDTALFEGSNVMVTIHNTSVLARTRQQDTNGPDFTPKYASNKTPDVAEEETQSQVLLTDEAMIAKDLKADIVASFPNKDNVLTGPNADTQSVSESFSDSEKSPSKSFVEFRTLDDSILATSILSSPVKETNNRALTEEFLNCLGTISPIKQDPDLIVPLNGNDDIVPAEVPTGEPNLFEDVASKSPELLFSEDVDKTNISTQQECDLIAVESPKLLKTYRGRGRSAQLMQLVSEATPDALQQNSPKKLRTRHGTKLAPSSSKIRRMSKLHARFNRSGNETPSSAGLEMLTFEKPLPSPLAKPSSSIIKCGKRKLEIDNDEITSSPSSKRKRVSFHDPPVSCEKQYVPEYTKNRVPRSLTSFFPNTLSMPSATITDATYEESLKDAESLGITQLEDSVVEVVTENSNTTIDNEAQFITNILTMDCNPSLAPYTGLSETEIISDNNDVTEIVVASSSADDSGDLQNMILNLSNDAHVEHNYPARRDSAVNCPDEDEEAICPPLMANQDSIELLIPELVHPSRVQKLKQSFNVRGIESVGDLAKLTELEVKSLPIKENKIKVAKQALQKHLKKKFAEVATIVETHMKTDKKSFHAVDSLRLGGSAVSRRRSSPGDLELLKNPSNERNIEQIDQLLANCRDSKDVSALLRVFINMIGTDFAFKALNDKLEMRHLAYKKDSQQFLVEALTHVGFNAATEGYIKYANAAVGEEAVCRRLVHTLQRSPKTASVLDKLTSKNVPPVRAKNSESTSTHDESPITDEIIKAFSKLPSEQLVSTMERIFKNRLN